MGGAAMVPAAIGVWLQHSLLLQLVPWRLLLSEPALPSFVFSFPSVLRRG